jgi:hypothetical protein
VVYYTFSEKAQIKRPNIAKKLVQDDIMTKNRQEGKMKQQQKRKRKRKEKKKRKRKERKKERKRKRKKEKKETRNEHESYLLSKNCVALVPRP